MSVSICKMVSLDTKISDSSACCESNWCLSSSVPWKVCCQILINTKLLLLLQLYSSLVTSYSRTLTLMNHAEWKSLRYLQCDEKPAPKNGLGHLRTRPLQLDEYPLILRDSIEGQLSSFQTSRSYICCSLLDLQHGSMYSRNFCGMGE